MTKRRIPSPWLGRGATDDDLDAYWGDCPCGDPDCPGGDECENYYEPDYEQMIADKEASLYD